MERLTDHEQEVATLIEGTIRDSMTNSERSRWAAEHRIGVSDIGHCREYLRRTLTQEEAQDDPNPMFAFAGTAIGDLVERALVKRHPHTLRQQQVTVNLDVGYYRLALPGHPDLVIPAEEEGESTQVWDLKTKTGLSLIQRSGPDQQQLFQLTLYGKAVIDQGLATPDSLVLSLIYLDRSGQDGPRPAVFSWRYDPADLEAAQQWLGDVFYAIENGEEASRDKERSWCEMWCKFAPTCRGFSNTDVTGLIEDHELVEAVRLYAEAGQRKREADKDQRAAKAVLQGIDGHTESHSLRWVKVGPADVPGFTRRAYEKIEIKEKKAPK